MALPYFFIEIAQYLNQILGSFPELVDWENVNIIYMGNIVLDFLSIKYGCTHINLNSVDVLPVNKQDENKQATFFVYYIVSILLICVPLQIHISFCGWVLELQPGPLQALWDVNSVTTSVPII